MKETHLHDRPPYRLRRRIEGEDGVDGIMGVSQLTVDEYVNTLCPVAQYKRTGRNIYM